MSGEELKYVQEAFDSNWIAPIGPNIDAFEKEICEYVGAEYSLAVTSGTAGIHLALRYLGVGPKDYVFCSDLTFIGSCAPILYQFANPVFIDCEENTWNMCPDALERAFEWAVQENKLPKAVIIVDLYGQSADFERLMPICRKYNVPVIEDAAEALGATYKEQHCGTFGDIGIYSFNGNKLITTSGGGMVVTNNKDAINKMRFWATQAREQEAHYEHLDFGYNYRMSNVLAGIGRGQLSYISKKIERRQQIFENYKNNLPITDIDMMPISEKGTPNYWLSVLQLKDGTKISPKMLIDKLEESNIESRPVWKPMHLQPIFEGSKHFTKEEFSRAEQLFSRGVCLPSGDNLDERKVGLILNRIQEMFL
jgi:pyridoxal phosphate-dependent aminotransferase EpsN